MSDASWLLDSVTGLENLTQILHHPKICQMVQWNKLFGVAMVRKPSVCIALIHEQRHFGQILDALHERRTLR